MVSARAFLLALLVGTAAFGQTPPEPRFDVASIKATFSPAELRSQGKAPPNSVTDAAQVRIYSTFGGLLRRAFRLESYEKVTGPDWMDTAWFEIVAKLTEGASQNDIPPMLKTLLTERMQLVANRQSRLEPACILTVDKQGSKLTEVSAESDGNAKAALAPGQVIILRAEMTKGYAMYTRLNGTVTLVANKITSLELATLLRKEAGLPVIDRTALDGFYSLSLPVPAIWLNKGTDSDPSGADLFKSVEKLGLHLEKGKSEIDSLVVEHAGKVPSGN